MTKVSPHRFSYWQAASLFEKVISQQFLLKNSNFELFKFYIQIIILELENEYKTREEKSKTENNWISLQHRVNHSTESE